MLPGNGLSERFWDSFCPEYNDVAQGDIPHQAVDILFGEGILKPEDSVLEVGCGKGAYSRLIAPKVRILTCMDISDRMLDHLFDTVRIRDYGKVERFHMDWNDYTPRKGYSVCFAAMLPRSSSDESMLRMEGAARERCATVVWEVNQREDLTLRIRDELGLDWPHRSHESDDTREWLERNDREHSEFRIRTSIDVMVPLDSVISKEVSRFTSAGFGQDVGEVARDVLEPDSIDGMVRYRAESSAVLYAWTPAGS